MVARAKEKIVTGSGKKLGSFTMSKALYMYLKKRPNNPIAVWLAEGSVWRVKQHTGRGYLVGGEFLLRPVGLTLPTVELILEHPDFLVSDDARVYALYFRREADGYGDMQVVVDSLAVQEKNDIWRIVKHYQ